MVILISGASHAGKTVLAQKLLERLHYPYLSIDHLKMGLIRSAQTNLMVCDDDALTDYLWPIIREMVKTAIENAQNLIVEGCYIPFDWEKSFEPAYLEQIRYCCLVMTRQHIETHFEEIRSHANDVEHRLDDSGLSMDWLIEENQHNLACCLKYQLDYVLIDDTYNIVSITRRIMDVLDL